MERLKTEREKAIQHAEDLGYQVEVLRAKLHEARRALMLRPAYDSADIGYQAEQLLRNAQMQAEQIRADAERELLLREPGAPWSPADVPLLDELAELLGEDDTREQEEQARQEREELAYAQGVLHIMEQDDEIADEEGPQAR